MMPNPGARARPLTLRACVAIVAAVLAGCQATTGRPPAALTPLVVVLPAEPREQTADQQVTHALNRLGFGARPGDVARVRELGVDQWIGLQLAPDRLQDTLADRVVASYEALHTSVAELARADAGAPVVRRAFGDAQSARLARAVVSERQLQEVMTDFWENHFSVYGGKGITRVLVPAYDRDVIRPLALGRFRDLLGAVAHSPAMLFYLDQWQSAADSGHRTLAERQAFRGTLRAAGKRRAGGLNENYARELLELHTLGVDAGYTQRDVGEVARALTGWTLVSRVQPEFVFRAAIHDADDKEVLGHRLPAGRGIEDGDAVLDLLARDPRCAHFLARKLAIRFVSDTPSPALVDRAAATYLRTDGDIREVVRTIVTSAEFFGRAAWRAKVKSPFELVASALRAVGADADTSLRSAQAVAALGEPIFGRQAPDGWPETGDAWINAGSILARINFGLVLAAGGLPGASVSRWPDAAHLRTASRPAQADAVVAAFLGGQASPDTRDILLQGENPLATAPGARSAMQLAGLTQMVGLAIGAPEFQRR